MKQNDRNLVKTTVVLLFCLVLGMSLCNIYREPLLVDDAFIGFRIAKNFAVGNGLVYNPGEHVMTSTTTLYALLNGVIWGVFGDSSIQFILGLNAVWHAVTVCFLFLLVYEGLASAGADPYPAYVSALFAGLFFATSAAVALIATCGMETPLYTLSICLPYYCYAKRQDGWAIFTSVIPFLIRPEGFLVSPVILLFVVFRSRRVNLGHLGIITLVVGPFLLILYYYYGTIIPQSIPAKKLYRIDRGTEIVDFLSTYFFTLKRLPMGFLFFSGLYYTGFVNRKLLPFIVWGVLYACLFTLVASWWKWYKPPFYMVYSSVAALGVYFWIEFLASRLPHRKITWGVAALLLSLLLLANVIVTSGQLKEGSSVYQGFLKGSKEISVAILQNTSADQRVMLEPLGMIGFYTFERVFRDYPGLCSPEVATILKRLNRKLKGTLNDSEALGSLVAEIKPDIIVLREREFMANQQAHSIDNYKVLAAVPMEFNGIDYFRHEGEANFYVLKRVNSD